MKNTKTVLVLRSCNPDFTSYGGFRWPKEGKVSCPDWNPEPVCGLGLHGFLWGEGDHMLSHMDGPAVWLVVRVRESEIVGLGGKVKFPRGVVVFSGSRDEAIDYLLKNGAAGCAVMYAKAAAGNGGTATAGYKGTVAAGEGGILQIHFRDGVRRRIRTAYVGENNVKPNTKYRLSYKGDFIPV